MDRLTRIDLATRSGEDLARDVEEANERIAELEACNSELKERVIAACERNIADVVGWGAENARLREVLREVLPSLILDASGLKLNAKTAMTNAAAAEADCKRLLERIKELKGE